ncbi:hypothetical protein SANTM175S_10252 [Streptomyces antimycoticus]
MLDAVDDRTIRPAVTLRVSTTPAWWGWLGYSSPGWSFQRQTSTVVGPEVVSISRASLPCVPAHSGITASADTDRTRSWDAPSIREDTETPRVSASRTRVAGQVADSLGLLRADQ